MGLFRFYGLVFRTAFTHSLSLAQDALFFAILVVGAAIWLAPSFHMTIDLTFAPNGWEVATITFGSILGLRLLLAPYWIWREQREQITNLIRTDFSDKKQSNVNSKMDDLPIEAKSELYRVITAAIQVHQLDSGIRSELERVGFVIPGYNYSFPEFIEEHRPFIEQWFKRNPP